MKISRLCLLVALSVLCTGLAFADGIPDPKIIIRGVQGGGFAKSSCPQSGCTNVGMNFEFNVPKHGSGTLFFTNASGKNWTSLKLIETGVPAAAITCQQSLFLSCSIRTLENGSVEILLSGGSRKGNNPRTGIANGQSFAIGFACVDHNCWPGGLGVSAHASSAPEPGTIALMVTGVGAILSRRKRWKNSLKA